MTEFLIVLQFGEYKHIHEIGSKPEVILYWVRDYVAISKKDIRIIN